MNASGGHFDVVIVGGGIVGGFAAFLLSKDGRKVALVERAGIGNQASGTNPGGINPMHGTGIPGTMREFSRWSCDLHHKYWDEISEFSGIDFQPKYPPRVHIALDESDLPALEKLYRLHEETDGFSARWLTREELPLLDARLDSSAIRGLWTEGNSKIRSRELTRATVAAAQKLGAEVLDAEATGLIGGEGKATGVALPSKTLECGAVLLATGPWVDQIERWTGFAVPIQPIKGELLEVKTEGLPIEHSFAWREFSIYGNGSREVWVGGNEEHAGFDFSITDAARDHILNGIRRMMPPLRVESVLRQITALRPVAIDDIPILGLAPGWSNVCLAYGGGRKGMLYGAGMGQAAADVLMQRPSDISIGHCSPGRFAK